MASPLLLLLLLLLLFSLLPPPSTATATANANAIFFETCPSRTCGSGFEIRFPVQLRSPDHPYNPNCSLPGLEVTCSSNNTTLLYLPSSPHLHLHVTSIDYSSQQLTFQLGSESELGPLSSSSSCPLSNLSLTSLDFLQESQQNYLSYSSYSISLISCPQKYANTTSIGGPISCLSGPGEFVYAVDAEQSMYVIPEGCVVVQTGGSLPHDGSRGYLGGAGDFGGVVEGFQRERKVYLNLFGGGDNYDYFEVGSTCRDCEAKGRRYCGYDHVNKEAFCQKGGHHGLLVKLITGTSVGGFFILGTVTLILYYITRLSKREKEMRIKVEKFLATYKNTKPVRYSYAGLSKITKRFKHKLGQGGFGTVYKGELLNGIPVAVKMLEKSKGEGQEFINEVATMGRIHHVNVVRLMGFCSEGSRHALVYEYMPNKSLEKFIFSKEARKTDKPFSMEKLLEIAIGIARGIEYLHQGCDHRILHFDIKPHNILLDHNFIPKISDFGLAKLCSRDQSIVTMTAARGTTGYIAPEIYSRNFGTVSYKSDVYSFGMLLMEMVSGKRNIDPAAENSGEVYFPEWVYNRLVRGEDVGLATEKGTDADVVKKLLIVALWCIQWSPTERPTMTRVVQLLMGNLESLQIPPKPFFSASDQDNNMLIIEVDGLEDEKTK